MTALVRFADGTEIAKEILDERTPETDQLLEKHKNSYPLCLCRGADATLKLYIARKTHYYVARMPTTGLQHAPDCPFYGAPASWSGLGTYSDAAITDGENDTVNVKLDVGLGVTPTRKAATQKSAAAAAEKKERDPTKKRSKVSLLGLLQLLWDKAEFNRWHPRMSGRRHYTTLYKYLTASAERVTLKKLPLLDYLYMPEPFYPEHKDAIEARAKQRHYELLLDSQGRNKRMVVVGLLKSITKSPYGYGIHLRHAPHAVVFWMNGEVAQEYAKGFSADQALDADVGALPRIMMLTVERTAKGSLVVHSAVSMQTTPEFIPFRTRQEESVIHDLVRDGRLFSKQLQYDAADDECFPDFLLLDAGDEPLPMYTFGDDAQPRRSMFAREAVKKMVDDKVPVWFWDQKWDAETRPAFPPQA